MKKRIDKTLCDTETATKIGVKYVGEFGQSDGYEEQLFITRSKKHFMYGNGGPESKYTKPNIVLATDEEAEAWKKENVKKPKPAKPKVQRKKKDSK